MTQDESGEGQGGLFLGRFYSSKWLAFPVLGHKKVLVHIVSLFEGRSELNTIVLYIQNVPQNLSHMVSDYSFPILLQQQKKQYVN